MASEKKKITRNVAQLHCIVKHYFVYCCIGFLIKKSNDVPQVIVYSCVTWTPWITRHKFVTQTWCKHIILSTVATVRYFYSLCLINSCSRDLDLNFKVLSWRVSRSKLMLWKLSVWADVQKAPCCRKWYPIIWLVQVATLTCMVTASPERLFRFR